jgi:hypothetical protein
MSGKSPGDKIFGFSDLGCAVTENEFDEVSKVPHYLRKWVHSEEVYLALVTGTRPVYFQESEEGYMWGSGSLFIVAWKGYQFAVTAKHVFTKSGADPMHTRILFPGSQTALPLVGAFWPQFPGHESQEEVEDLYLLQIDHENPHLQDEDAPDYYIWKLEDFVVPAKYFPDGEQVFAVGYPSHDERFDYDNQKLRETAMVAIGKIRKGKGEGRFEIDCAEFPMEIGGASGGPVFARVQGFFVFIGVMVRGGAAGQTIHFVDALYVIHTLNNTVKKIEAQKG